MKDTIYREDAIKEIESLVASMTVCGNMDNWEGMQSMKKRAINALKNMPSAKIEEVEE